MATLEEYNRRKPIELIKTTGVRISHSSITTLYLVADNVDNRTLNDENGTSRTWQGASLTFARPSGGRASISFGRVGTDVYNILKDINGFDRIEPIKVTLYDWLSDSMTPKSTVTLDLQSVTTTIDGVTIAASVTNAATLRVSERYTIGEFPGLEYA